MKLSLGIILALVCFVNFGWAEETTTKPEGERFGSLDTFGDDYGDAGFGDDEFGGQLGVDEFGGDEFGGDEGFAEGETSALNEEFAEELSDIEGFSEDEDGTFVQVEDRFFKWIKRKVKKAVKKVKKIGSAVLPYVKRGWKMYKFYKCMRRYRSARRCRRYLRSGSGNVGGPWCPKTSKFDEFEDYVTRRKREAGDTDYQENEHTKTSTISGTNEGTEDERLGGYRRRPPPFRRCRNHRSCYRSGKVCCPNRRRRMFMCRAPLLKMTSTNRGIHVTVPFEEEESSDFGDEFGEEIGDEFADGFDY